MKYHLPLSEQLVHKAPLSHKSKGILWSSCTSVGIGMLKFLNKMVDTLANFWLR